LLAHPGAPAVFVFDAELIAGRAPTAGGHPAVAEPPQPLAAGRLRFLRQCLEGLPAQVRQGDVAQELLAAAAAQGCDGIVTSRAVDPRFSQIASRLTEALPLGILEPEPFVDLPLLGAGAPDLTRFSRYWRRAEPRVWGESVSSSGRRGRGLRR
jgi:deoxyribodipyrimidine photo-lyase